MLNLETSLTKLHQQAEYYISQEKWQEAITICQHALKIKQNLKSYKILGVVFQIQGQLENALQCYLNALEIKPDDVETYINIASLYTQQQQYKDAIISYKVALRLDQKSEKTYLDLGNILIKLSRLHEAITCYYQVINLNPDSGIAYQKLGDVYFKLQQWDDAILAYRRVLELHPNALWSCLYLGKSYIYKQQWDDAIQTCYQAIKINPQAAWSYKNLGDTFFHKNQYNDAAIAYIYALNVRKNPFNSSFTKTIYQQLGEVIRQQIKQSDIESILSWYYYVFQNQLVINYPLNITELGFIPNTPEPYLRFGDSFVQSQQFEAAIIFYQLADKIQPNTPEIIIKLKQVFNQHQNFQQFLTECYQNLEQNPNSPDAYTKLGNLLTQQGQIKEAVHYHQKALVLKGWSLCQQRNYQFTQDWFSNNIRIWKKHLSLYSNTPELSILEIGSYQGMSTCWFIDHLLTHPTAKITCIDPYFKPEFDDNIFKTNAVHKVTKMIAYSQDILDSLPANFYDIVYIDGCHLAMTALQDALKSWRLTKVGGIIIFDDYEVKEQDNPEQQAKVGIDYFLNGVSDAIEIIDQGYQLMIRKKATGLSDEEIDKALKNISISKSI
jgi:tetratricopeptide (TPR) repeat protein